MPLLRISREEWEKTIETYRKTGVALKEDVIKRIDELNDAIKRTTEGIKALGARLYAATSEYLKPFINKANEFIGKLNEFFDKHPQLAGLVGLIWLLGGAISSILGSLLVFGANIAIIAGNWTALKNILLKTFGVFGIFKKVFDWVKHGVLRLGGVFGFLSRIFTWVRYGAMLLVGVIAKLAAALGWPIWAVIALIAVIGLVIAAIIKFRKEIWEFVKKAAKWFWEGLKKIASYVWDFLKLIWERIKKLPSMFWEGLKGAISAVYEWGKNLVRQFWKGIKALANKPVEAFKEILQKIRDMLPFSPPKKGPLKDLPASVRKLIQIFADAIKKEKDPIIKAFLRLLAVKVITEEMERVARRSVEIMGRVMVSTARIVYTGLGEQLRRAYQAEISKHLRFAPIAFQKPLIIIEPRYKLIAVREFRRERVLLVKPMQELLSYVGRFISLAAPSLPLAFRTFGVGSAMKTYALYVAFTFDKKFPDEVEERIKWLIENQFIPALKRVF